MRRLVILLSAQVCAVTVLVALHRTFLQPLGAAADPGDTVAAGLWVMALGAASWLLVTTLAFLAVESLPTLPRRLHSSVASVTPRMIRVVVTRAVAVSMLASATALPAASTALAAVRTGREPVATTTTTTIATLPDAQAGEPGVPEAPTPEVIALRTDPAERSPSEHRVVPGDNLWAIAAAHLRSIVGAVPSDVQIAPYWARVVEENRPHLRSGDPDLIFPGEVVVLPELTVHPEASR